jgi:radical SAM superfamily enzyme YgiQ (UPF0313 family)
MLADFRPDFVGISVRNIDDVLIRKRETYFNQLGALCDAVRRINPCPVVLGGSGFSIFPRELLAFTGADFGIQGEGEAAFVALIAAYSRGWEFTNIPGLVFRRGSEVMANPQLPACRADPIEVVDRPDRLVKHYLQHAGMLNVQTQRGCAHSCCYCTYPVIEGHAHRERPPEAVAEEMALLESRGAKYVFIVDSVFNSSSRHVAQTCEAMIRRHLSLRWGCFLRPQGLTAELMKLMARAGLAHVEFGSDSFCDEVLSAYEKRLTFSDILQSHELARNHKVECCHFLICGGPGETVGTLESSFSNSLKLEGAVIMAVAGMRIYPGTALQERALHERRITSETNLLSPEYYLAAGLSELQVFEKLQEFSRRSPNWIVGDPPAGYARMVERMRSRGVVGPLWSYLPLMQRLWLAGLTTTPV